MHNVFISYKAEEFDEALWVKNELEANDISCWLAPMSIPGGSSYANEIDRAIRDCDVFVLILSSRAQSSIWVEKELNLALTYNKTVVPFAIENCPLHGAFNFFLSNVQRYYAYANKQQAMRDMLELINLSVVPPAKEPEPVSNTEQIKEEKSETPLPSPEEEQRAVSQKATEHIKKRSGKKLPLIIFAIIAALAAIAAGVVALIWGGDEAIDDARQEEREPVMSQTLYDFTFELEGKVYSLPCSYKRFSGSGWSIASSGYSEETVIKAGDYHTFVMKRGESRIWIYIVNDGNEDAKIADCKVGGVRCEKSYNSDFKIAKNITLHSTLEEVQAAFGSPTSKAENDYLVVTVLYKESKHRYAKIVLDPVYEEDMYIELLNFPESVD